MRIKRLDLIKDDPAKVMDVLEKGTLGNKLDCSEQWGMVMSCEAVSKSILEEMLSRHRRIDHREHPLMIGYFSQLGFEVAHLTTERGRHERWHD